MDFATITINGTLLDRFLPVGSKYGVGGNCTITRAVTVDADVIRQIDAAEAEGIRRLLVVVDSFGGYLDSAYAVAGRLERFREGGGIVVSFVALADSSAPLLAVTADYVVLAPEGRIALHAAGRPEDDAGHLHALHERMGAALSRGTGLTADSLVDLMDGGHGLFVLAGKRAMNWGFADEIGTIDRARELAAGATLPETERQRRLGRWAPADRQATMSSEARVTGPRNVPAWVRTHMAALGNWTKHAMPTGDFYAVALGDSVFAAVGLSAACATSPDGATWTARTIPAADYYAAAWNGSVFVAVGSNGAGGACATSPDGVTWTARTIPAGAYRGIVWNGSLFVAVGESAACATSPDGITWTGQSIVSNSYNGIAWNGTAFCAVGASSACAVSTDGVHWVSRTIPAGSYRAITWSGSVFVAVGSSNVCATSTDGSTWTARTIPSVPGGARYLWSVAWTGTAFVVVEFTAGIANAACYVSLDGVFWWAFTTGMPTSGSGWRGIVWDGHCGVAVGQNAAATSLAS